MTTKQMSSQQKKKLARFERATELILQGVRRKDAQLQLQEEFGAATTTVREDYESAYNSCMELRKLRCEQMQVAESMYMGGFRNMRIAEALVANWGVGGDAVVENYPLTEEEADEIVQYARERVDGETPQTKEGKRARLALWFEDKMMNAQKDRDQIRAAALYMRLEGLADTSEYEPPADDIVIELGDWRSTFATQLKEGKAPSASRPIVTPLNGNGNGKSSGIEISIEE